MFTLKVLDAIQIQQILQVQDISLSQEDNGFKNIIFSCFSTNLNDGIIVDDNIFLYNMLLTGQGQCAGAGDAG